MSRVITNLLSNAVKFTPDSGVITLRANRVSEDGGMCILRIEVQDTGIGISEEHQTRLFHSSEQAYASTSRKFGSTGLGLAISKRIVQMLGGDIWVASEEDKGSRFIFTIRAKRGRSDDHATSAPNLDWERLHILAADDAKDAREYFSNLATLSTSIATPRATDLKRKTSCWRTARITMWCLWTCTCPTWGWSSHA